MGGLKARTWVRAFFIVGRDNRSEPPEENIRLPLGERIWAACRDSLRVARSLCLRVPCFARLAFLDYPFHDKIDDTGQEDYRDTVSDFMAVSRGQSGNVFGGLDFGKGFPDDPSQDGQHDVP